MKKIIFNAHALGAIISLFLLCSCATTPEPSLFVPASERPADVTMNDDAGRGNDLFVTLRLEGGEELLFVVDTGAPVTCFDRSLESKLGKRLGEDTAWNFANKQTAGIYAAPKLYLGNTLLITGSNIYTIDLKPTLTFSGRPVMGVLGLDCLCHYCIQLDFEAGKIQFLDPNHLNVAELGKAFPLELACEDWKHRDQVSPRIRCGSLIGEKDMPSMIDTGCNSDGVMKPWLLRREVWEQGGVFTADENAHFPKCTWEGESYTNLTIRTWPTRVQSLVHLPNLIGLGFLARHLVTFDFPHRMMYLKRTSIGPLVDETRESALKSLKGLMGKGLLPGWAKNEKGTFDSLPIADANCVTYHFRKDGDSSVYHYTVVRVRKDDPWKLQKAWRTDQNGHKIEEYPVP